MIEAALNIAAEQTVEASASGTVLGRQGNRSERSAPQGVYRCAGDDRWVALEVSSDERWGALRTLLGGPASASGSDLDTHAGRAAAHDELDAWLSAAFADRDADELAAALRAVGVPAEVVIAAPHVVDNAQLQHRGLFEVEHHRVTGDVHLPTLPFRLSRVDRWLRRPAPTLGEHTDEVLAEVGIAEDRLASLLADGVTGTRPVGA
jgi:crotonobetainyl-CoA:carnitine CoA-transferase CaiB-like acyl-CoA transferase